VEFLILRLDAPLMSFGGVKVNSHANTERFPSVSMITGLLANALGLSYHDTQAMQLLQDNLAIAARWDVKPQRMKDYQTVDLGSAKMAQPGWTTRGIKEHRDGGHKVKFGTEQRYVHYWENGVATVAVALNEAAAGYPIEELEAALRQPARPLFLGRKTCLPAAPVFLCTTESDDIVSALKSIDLDARSDNATCLSCWPEELGELTAQCSLSSITGGRNWKNRLPLASRRHYEGLIEYKKAPNND